MLGQLAYGAFERAIKRDDAAFAYAEDFSVRATGREATDELLPRMELARLEARGKWRTLIDLHDAAKARGERDNGYLNHVSYQVYRKCDDREAMATCVGWMAEVVAEEPTFDYLDTYAFLLHKYGDHARAAEYAARAIEAGEREGRKTDGLKQLLEQD